MDKKKLQTDILEESYQSEKWLEVLKGYFNAKKFHQTPKPITNLPSNDLAEAAYEIGSFYTEDERLIGIYEVRLTQKAWIDKNRVGLRNILRQVYKYDVDGALIVFVQKDKWRFSYVSEIRTEEGRKETEPKRYTYLFGKGESCRTAADRFDKLKGNPIYLNDLLDAFSIDKLNKDFFKTYKEFYEKFWKYLAADKKYYKLLVDKKQITEEKKQKPIRDFAKKLLGRIVFLHFLQKKGWMGVPASNLDWKGGDRKFLQTLFSVTKNKQKFHSETLSVLFFDTLNNKRKDDLAPISLGKDIKIPYLNGGLFEKNNSFESDIDFPEDLFSNVLDFFEQYNFTIDENDPYDSEVGIDPEMLGHIFENLLEENKDKGAFYTPKEVVHYMCQESLIEYLHTELPNYERNNFEFLVRNNQMTKSITDYKNANEIYDKLKSVKICDPAIGSGAFPMGLLKEIYECRRLLYGYLRTNEKFDPAEVKKEIIQKNIYGVDLENGAVEIARLRFWLALVVDEITPHPLPNLDYKIMQGNSLLERFENVDLSYVASNNLKIIEPQKDLFGNVKENQLKITYTKTEIVAEIQKRMKKFFNLENAELKEQYRNEINSLVHEHISFNFDLRNIQIQRWIAELENGSSQTDKQSRKILEYKEQLTDLKVSYEKLKELETRNDKPFFLWHLFFNDVFENGGFDILIGNPPYIQLQKLGKDADDLQEAGFDTFTRTGDVYCLFYEQAFKVLKKGGNLVYITGSAWLRSNYGKALRRFFIQNTNPIKLIDLSDCQIFQSATVLTTIFQYKKEPSRNQLKSLRLTRKTQHFVNQLNSYFDENASLIDNPNESAWTINDKEKADIKKDVFNQGKLLKDWKINIVRGIVTGLNEAFVVNQATRDLIISLDKNSKNIIKPLLRGRDLSKYSYKNEHLWLIGTFPTLELDIEKYPAIKKHLLSFGKENLEQSGVGSGKKTSNQWFETQDQINYWKNFEQPKILYPNMVKDISFAYDDKGYYTNQKCFILTGEKLKYLLGVLNSKLFRYCFEEDFPELQGNSREINKVVFEQIPLKYPSKIEEQIVQFLVEYLLYLYNPENKDLITHTPNIRIAKTLEEVLNMVVYELYFGDYMKSKKINVIEHLEGVAMLEINATPEAIFTFYKWLQMPDNKVRNNILALDIKSKDLLSPINSTTK